VFASISLALSTLRGIPDGELPRQSLLVGIATFAPLYAWLALAVMTQAWIVNRKVHRFWPVSGTLTGLPSAILFSPLAFPFYAPAAALAFYLVYFHLRNAQPFDHSAT
jgi:hypothetical protein